MTIENKYYNKEIKERFIKSLGTTAIQQYSEYPLKKAIRTENMYDKDLYDMTLEEIGEVISDLSCSTVDAAYNNLLKIEEYIDWAIEEGYRKSNINPLSNLSNKREWSKQFVSAYRSYLFTKKHIIGMMNQLENEVDQAVLLALFEGVEGKGFSELLNLKTTDIITEGDQNFLNLIDDAGKERTIPVSELLAKKLREANDQKEYINKNGLTLNKRYNTSKIEESEFIFNKTTRGKQGGRPDGFYVRRKFKEFKQIFVYEHLVTKHIKDSGISHMANELQVDEVLSKDAMKQIAEQFDTSYTTIPNGDKYRNLTKIKQVVQAKDFEKRYGYTMKF